MAPPWSGSSRAAAFPERRHTDVGLPQAAKLRSSSPRQTELSQSLPDAPVSPVEVAPPAGAVPADGVPSAPSSAPYAPPPARFAAPAARFSSSPALAAPGGPPPPPVPSPPAAPGGKARAPKPARPLRAVWFTLNDMGTLRDAPKLEEAVRQLGRLGFTTLYPVVWNGGYTYTAGTVTQQRQLQSFTLRGLQGQDPLADLIRLAREQGMQVLPWFEFGFMAPPSSELATRHPQWLTQKRDGSLTSMSAAGEVVWLNPFRPEVQQLLIELMLEVVNLYEVDGVQFDDHFSLPIAFGYDPYTRALFRKETGRDVPTNSEDAAWLRWRADKLTAFVRRLRVALKARDSSLIFSLSPNYADFAYKLQLQDWRAWVKAGLVDEVVVQLYRPDLESFTTELNRPEFAETKVPMAVALMAGQRLRPTDPVLLQGKVAAARQRGLGVAFFHYGPLWEATADAEGRLRGLEGMLGVGGVSRGTPTQPGGNGGE
ncbi:MAG: family 10 glycosylhydrolase [Cyanobacteriota bacterium]|nr:family 10 glycosylhydrolase [Cyanobacteriota bacterium]